ncbi:iron export ABC transporter permease subunit FetB [Geobacter sp. SVR]|uniref:ABC transporter permease n=1 Tax=Geobacter sp. SVR TaxID=2495594 RepID=UPI00143F003E|nr:iron export ABC transporter permease subunit FetB [Geobacter sp. SVR]BCS55034.1 iron export ABC transporter permease subunit FetB [Geobacter sp. SVR]GCF85215.1 iron export ABC transporter permease subunit FetB [Geobacter sp. SVR]
MENNHVVPMDLLQLSCAYGLILLSIALTRLRKIGQEKQLLWASIRMVLQLLAVGYLLHVVFTVRSPLPVVLMLLAMTGFSLQVAGTRIKKRMPHFYRVAGSSIIIGCGGVTFYFCSLVVGYTPWFDPRYLIPLAGMIIGNAMNGASLAAERLTSEMYERREEIETALCLGATTRQAAEPAVRAAYAASLIPTMNTMAATGIVALPGMMTGQILSGTEPIVAVRYQIAIMCAITGAVAITSFMLLLQGYRHYFTEAHQLKG